MNTGPNHHRSESGPVGAARLSWPRLAVAGVACPAIGLVTAWLALFAQSFFAPLVVFPLLVGVLLGGLVFALMRFSQMGHRPTVWLGTLLAIGGAVAGQHYFAYLEVYGWPADKVDGQGPRAAELAELLDRSIPSFAEFLDGQARRGRRLWGAYVAKGWVAWLTWIGDGVLVMAAALAVVIPASRLPYCDRCKSWFIVGRSGRVDGAAGGRLAEVAETTLPEAVVSVRFRVLHCAGGCGPTALELAWETSGGDPGWRHAWLDKEGRDRLTQVIDELVSH
jgi:hypothetical protein